MAKRGAHEHRSGPAAPRVVPNPLHSYSAMLFTDVEHSVEAHVSMLTSFPCFLHSVDLNLLGVAHKQQFESVSALCQLSL